MRNKLTITFVLAFNLLIAQPYVPYPGSYFDCMNLNNHQTANNLIYNIPGIIISPSSPACSTHIYNSASVQFLSGTEVHLSDGFHAGEFICTTSLGPNVYCGSFHAGIDNSTDAEVVLIPNNYTRIDNTGSIPVVHIPKWEKFEIGVHLPQEYLTAIDNFFAHYFNETIDNNHKENYLNPYADDTLVMEMSLSNPSGTKTKIVYGFFMRMAMWTNNGANPTDEITDDISNGLNNYPVRFRFAPDEESTAPWTFRIDIYANNVISAGQPLPLISINGLTFICDAPLFDNKGFLHVNQNNKRYLKFDNGDSFYALGENLVDVAHRFATGYDLLKFYKRDFDNLNSAIDELHTTGANWARLWLYKWNFAPEWEHLGVYDEYSNTPPACPDWPACNSTVWITGFNSGNRQRNCWAFDQIIDKARQNNIYLKLGIDPNTPSTGGQGYMWGDNCYVREYMYPMGNYQTNVFQNQLDASLYFVSAQQSNNWDSEGSMLYWKRKYKYIMARWGYSVNIAVFETNSELDFTLGYVDQDVSNLCCCISNTNLTHTYNQNTNLIPQINRYISTLSTYGKLILNDPLRPFTVSFGNNVFDGWNTGSLTTSQYFSPLTMPEIDIADVHHYSDDISTNSRRYDIQEQAHSINPLGPYNIGLKIDKPFQLGEGSSFMGQVLVTYNGQSTGVDLSSMFHNYASTFHNELWSSVFMNTFGTTMTWQWGVVHWWEDATPIPNQEPLINTTPTNVLSGTNYIQPILNQNESIVNTQKVDTYQPISAFIQASDFNLALDENFHTYKIYPTAQQSTGEIESYYMVNQTQQIAFGWVHNVNKYWGNDYYYMQSQQNYFGCIDLLATNPPSNQFTLSDPNSNLFLPSTDYDVTFYKTMPGSVTLPNDVTVTSDLNGNLIIPIGNVNGVHLDCGDHADFAFRVLLSGYVIQRMMQSNENNKQQNTFEFTVQPNPNSGIFDLVLPRLEVENINVLIFGITGQKIYQQEVPFTQLLSINVNTYAKGIYNAIVIAGNQISSKRFIIQ